MADDEDGLAARAISLLHVAIAVIAEEIDDLATLRRPFDQAKLASERMAVAGEDISQLARACAVLHRRAESF